MANGVLIAAECFPPLRLFFSIAFKLGGVRVSSDITVKRAATRINYDEKGKEKLFRGML